MKKFFGMMAIAAVLVACGNDSESTEVEMTDTTVVAPVEVDTTTIMVDTTATMDTMPQ